LRVFHAKSVFWTLSGLFRKIDNIFFFAEKSHFFAEKLRLFPNVFRENPRKPDFVREIFGKSPIFGIFPRKSGVFRDKKRGSVPEKRPGRASRRASHAKSVSGRFREKRELIIFPGI